MSQGKDKPAFVEQVGGDHYQQPIQVWDFVVANKIGFLEGNVIKYVERWERKDGMKDLLKAKSYVDKLIAVEKARLAAEPEKKIPSIPKMAGKDYEHGAWIEHNGSRNCPVDSETPVRYETIEGNVYSVLRAGVLMWEGIKRYQVTSRL
jgi:hypothetical protein